MTVDGILDELESLLIDASRVPFTNKRIIEEDDVMKLLDYLPEGCRLVFTLYVIEGYKHKEIAESLGITEGTSKSQLNLAKTKLKEMLSKNENIKSNLS